DVPKLHRLVVRRVQFCAKEADKTVEPARLARVSPVEREEFCLNVVTQVNRGSVIDIEREILPRTTDVPSQIDAHFANRAAAATPDGPRLRSAEGDRQADEVPGGTTRPTGRRRRQATAAERDFVAFEFVFVAIVDADRFDIQVA